MPEHIEIRRKTDGKILRASIDKARELLKTNEWVLTNGNGKRTAK